MSMMRFAKNIMLVLAGLLTVGSCKRVPLYDSSSHIVLELQLKLNQDLTVSDTVDLNSYPQYYDKVHLKSPERLAACFYDVNSHQMVAKEYVGPTGGYITSKGAVFQLSPGGTPQGRRPAVRAVSVLRPP